MSEGIDQQQFVDAWDRIARTADGEIVYRHLQRIRLGLAPDLQGGALRHFEGRRSLAADLMAYMAEGIERSAGRDATERPVIFAVRQPAIAVGKRTTARDWLRDNADAEPKPAAAGAEPS